ncbi:carbohydrate ABC transporter permease [Paraburkholderia susongensis]|uniref:Carbohydrate ABC transporter membrane protein 1, CUT1 family n=1 Tax=Paraburkholderia susongensis TaxID=1515439 RepID=A0A1X7LM26_9BURK|nr:sugar ABC transporter permease [Paraburkholderia susongensis]SMG54956.1 carbohydrate ABC transporter membrane protein 1, CUT1 family [Paraburkholderia susongensis]
MDQVSPGLVGQPAKPVSAAPAPAQPERWVAARTWALGRSRRAETLTAWALVLPALVGFTVFYGWPMLRAIEISFTDWNLLRPPQFVGFDNYRAMLQDGQFWQAMKLSAYYVALNIPLQTVLGLFLAVAMDRLSRSLFIKSVVLLPYLLSNVLVAMMWLWMLDPLLGWVNFVLGGVGIDRQPFFGGVDQALITVAAVNIWRYTGLVAMLFLAGLQNIPRTLYEAATLEGAGEWQMFRRITLPLLRPVMVFVLVTSVTGSFQIFDTIAVTTKGGPLDSTRVLVYYIVENAFSFYKMGYASAMSVTLCVLMLLYTVIQMRVMHASENDLA